MTETRCAGVSLRGYRVGEPCGAIPKYEARGKPYCASHYVVALKQPKRFREALEAYFRGEARRERARRVMDAAARQIDAFPVLVPGTDPELNALEVTAYSGSDSCGARGALYAVPDGHVCADDSPETDVVPTY